MLRFKVDVDFKLRFPERTFWIKPFEEFLSEKTVQTNHITIEQWETYFSKLHTPKTINGNREEQKVREDEIKYQSIKNE